MVALAALLVACGDGPSDETLVDELRIISAVAEPPELGSGQYVTLYADVVLAGAESVDMIMWSCTPVPDGCLEDGLPLGSRLAAPDVIGSQARATLQAPELGAPDGAPFVTWLLACTPGTCSVISEARTALNLGTEFPPSLRDPNALLQQLPTTGVSLAQREVIVSERPDELRNRNPTISLTGPIGLDIGTDEVLTIPLQVDDPGEADELFVVGLATAGGFDMPRVDVRSGPLSLDYFAPTEPGPVTVYVLVEDGRAGSAVWTADLTVR